MAYFVLPGRGKRVYRLAVARRIVDGTARGARDRSPAGYARRRTRVLRRALRPSRRLRVGLGPWLRALPPRLPDPALTAALARLDPHVRVAYVLRHVEGLPRYAVRDQLIELRVRDPWAAIRAADATRPPGGRRPERFEPVLRPVRTRSALPLVTAALLTAGLVAVLVATEHDGPRRPGGPRITAAAPDAWRRVRTLDAWPARGDLVRDPAFTGRAARAWAEPRVQLLYAGRVDGAPVAVLRSGDRLARFTRAGLAAVAAPADPSAPIALGGGRYLLAPWDPRPEALAGGPLPVADGVTAPVRAGTACGRGPLFHLGARTVGDLDGPHAAVLGYHGPDHRADGAERPARLGPDGRRIWRRVACLTRPAARPVTEATAWDFWTGPLPDGGKTADWVCTRLAYSGGATARAALLGAADRGAEADRDTGPCDARRPVSGTRWRAPSGRWYYLAAAGRGLVPHAKGVLGSDTRDRLLVAPGPRGARVTLTAR